jgi:plasmid maintenance system antidote protein VapI
MSQPLTQESKTFQEFVRDSFIKLPNKTINLIKKLQSVEWAGKQEALKLFELVDNDKDTMDRLVNMINLDESHKEEFEGDETSNKDKEKDLQQIRDFLNAGSKPFWYRYKAQKQNRLRIDSNGINGQRSKLHRALFMPKSANVLIDSAFSRALYQLGIAQALGYPIDKNDLPGAMAAFEKMYVQALPLVNLIKKGNVNSKEFNKLLNQLLDNKEIEIEPSMHVLEAIASLANYDPNNAFKTASLGIETDGITNGYAIAQMQLKGVPSRILKMPKGEERDLEIVNHLTKSFAQIGVMIGTNEDGSPRTMEGFIKDGELDVYQALAKVIRDTLNKPSAIDEINALKGRIYGPRLKEEHIKAIDTIHGEICDKAKEKISSFGRNLAKNPLMISGYGAEIERIISALAEDIVPTTHKKLAEFQVKRDKAKTPEEIKAVRKEFNKYLKELDLFKPGIKTNIKNHLAEGKSLKEYTLSESEQIRLKSSFRRMFEPSVTAALNEFTTPLKNARDAIIKSGEIQFITFMYKFEEALAQYRTDVGLKPNANVSRSVREGIAEELALKHMPLVYGPWSQQSPLQIIKTKLNTKNKDEARVNIVFNGKQSVRHFAKNGYKFIPVKENDGVIRRESITSNAYSRTYVEPSVSMYSNTIQNIDSVIIGEAMAKNPEVLGIFDALMSNITDSFDNNTRYNESFRKVSRDFSIIENAFKRLVEVKKDLTDIEITNIEKLYRKNSFEGKNLQKRIDLTRNAKQKQSLETQKKGLGFKNIESLFEE